jgi:hypothetical protein
MSLINRLRCLLEMSRFEVKLADLWIGVYWEWSQDVLEIWICFVPCIPLHIQIIPPVQTLPEYSQEEYELYMTGFRLGHPLVGEPSVVVSAPDHPAFQRGLRAGHKAFRRAGCPQIAYEAAQEG